jgi:hypothetical protein
MTESSRPGFVTRCVLLLIPEGVNSLRDPRKCSSELNINVTTCNLIFWNMSHRESFYILKFACAVFIIVLQQLILYNLCNDIIYLYDITVTLILSLIRCSSCYFSVVLAFWGAPFTTAFVGRLNEPLVSHVAARKQLHLNQRFAKKRHKSDMQQKLEFSKLFFLVPKVST